MKNCKFSEIVEIANELSKQIMDISCGSYNPHFPDHRFSTQSSYEEYRDYCFLKNSIPIDASKLPGDILSYFEENIKRSFPNEIFIPLNIDNLHQYLTKYFYNDEIYAGHYLNIPFAFPFMNNFEIRSYCEERKRTARSEVDKVERYLNSTTGIVPKKLYWEEQNYNRNKNILNLDVSKVTEFVENKINDFSLKQTQTIDTFKKLRYKYNSSSDEILDYLTFLLNFSWYRYSFKKKIDLCFNVDEDTIVVNYNLPSIDDIPKSDYKIYSSSKRNEWKPLSEAKFKKLYEDVLYAIVLRTICEIFIYDDKTYIKNLCFNGFTNNRSPITGLPEDKCILSILVARNQVSNLDLNYVNPKAWFKHCKGISATKIFDNVEIKPILSFTEDNRYVMPKNVDISIGDNLAEMNWEDFEHLVRQVFEWEFSEKGGEVKVTRSSRDGGVDAIVLDPDPIRGGKIIIQAKRYTNTVPVSAVRDLYGTIINEGANKGILITTSDYGSDSYKFAQGKPITLLNGGHLLYLLNKHGKSARIDIEEARKNLHNS